MICGHILGTQEWAWLESIILDSTELKLSSDWLGNCATGSSVGEYPEPQGPTRLYLSSGMSSYIVSGDYEVTTGCLTLSKL